MKISFGSAVYRDFNGAWATIMGLLEYHGELVHEFVLVDNDPDNRDNAPPKPGEPGMYTALANMIGPRLKYVYAPEAVGTAAPRNRVFTEASGDVVCCLDCHVFLRVGAAKALADFYAAHPDYAGLVQGPMLYENYRSYATHFIDVWNDGMRGVWGAARRCPGCDTPLTTMIEARDDGSVTVGWTGLMTATLAERYTNCPGCQRPLPTPGWYGHENVLDAAGFLPAWDGEPFEIPAQGLGLFACRKDAWLGFNPKFRGFGGEEIYVHEKYRRAGHKTLCLPQFQWIHRFGRAGGVQYPLTVWDKVRNYVLGARELGWPVEPIFDHFVKTGLLPAHEWNQLLDGRDWPVGTEGNGCASCPGALAAEPPPLGQWYEQAWKTPSDINEHCPTLREYAAKSESVVEFGHRRGVSAVAILAGQPKRFTSYDNSVDVVPGLAQRAGATEFHFVRGDSRSVDIEACDALFIDTTHTADCLAAELDRHAGKVRKWILLHDTVIFGEKGEDGGPGLLVALRAFLRANPEWSVVRHDANNHGFTVISRVPEEKPKLPSTARQVWNYGKALAKKLTAKVKGDELFVTEEVLGRRLDACALCPQRVNDRCSVCGCFLIEVPEGYPNAGEEGRAMRADMDCPLAKWPAPLSLPLVKS